MNREGYVVVIGASNIDIGGHPHRPLIFADSNPGNITVGFGGVGRNIAHNLSSLGADTKLITAAGNDVLGREMMQSCADAGIDISYSLTDLDSLSSMYLYINDEKGEMSVAVSHVDIINNITPEYLDSVEPVINNACAAVADCNISHDTFIHLKEICKVPLYVDPVSITHAEKIKGYLDGIDTLKPNRYEAEYLTDIRIEYPDDYYAAARSLIDQGVRKVFISDGSRGILAADRNGIYRIRRYPADVVSTTGAGDSAMAAIVWASMIRENDICYAARAANAVAAMTIEVSETNDPHLSRGSALKRIESYEPSIEKIEEYDDNE